MQGLRQEDNALIFERDYEILRIEPWGRDALRVRATMGPEIREELPGALLDLAAPPAEIEIDGESATIRNGAIAARLITGKGRIHFLNARTGAELVSEAPGHFPRPPARIFKSVGGDLWRIEARFSAYDGERLYGLGQHQHGRLDQKGCVVDLFQVNTEVCIPFLLSNRGYGLLWNNPAIGRVELGQDQTRWVAEAASQLDYWITAGDSPGAILGHYVDATGHAPMLPEWAAGFWQCKLRYRTQDELLSIAREYQRRGLPLSVIVVDFFHASSQGDWQFDPQCWPDPSAMVRELNGMGVKLMVSIWPTVSTYSRNYDEMQRRGLLVRSERGLPALKLFRERGVDVPVYVHFYDATNAEARCFVWDQVRRGYYEHGIKVWWLDADEPEIGTRDPENLRFQAGNGQAVMNIYPLLHAQAFYEGMRGAGEQEIVLLSRSAWAGSQRYGAAVWSGDIPSTFESLQTQVRAGLNIGLSGIPWWTTDIGGFVGGDTESNYFRELIVRWFQYGAFCPLFRLHGYRLPDNKMWDTGGPNEVWSFGDAAYVILRNLLFLRERLRPYIMGLVRAAHQQGTPPMRPLFYDFPDDAASWPIEDQFMFGPDLLVAPVLEQGARSRSVYLPSGTTWRDAWTDRQLDGGQRITADGPLDCIPLYLRAGASLPIRVS